MIQIYDVDRNLAEDEIRDLIKTQNSDLFDANEDVGITPIFKRSPREGPAVGWVCVVKPSTLDKILKLGRLYIGLSKCRVTEKFDITQCFGCCKFGHRQADCWNRKLVCSYCGDERHKKDVCNSKRYQPYCANCGEDHEATDRNCRVRKTAIIGLLKKRIINNNNEE